MAINRDALLIHLRYLKILETIIDESKKTKDTLIEKSNEEFVPVAAPKEPLRPSKPDSVWVGLYVLFLIFFIPFLISTCIVVLDLRKYGYGIKYGFSDKAYFCLFIATTCLMFACMPLFYLIKDKRKYKKESMIYSEKMRTYETKMETYRSELIRIEDINRNNENQHIRDKEEMVECANVITIDIEYYENLLKESYSADIIPMQFRNIEGIYYLYDFLSTSQLSLSDAIINANMQEIKNKLDEVINMQKEMVIKQAESNAQLAEIRSTNEQILESARATEQNSFVAA